MLVIRLQRTGRKNAPAYRVVVAENSAPIQGKCVDQIGHYLPTRNPAEFECNQDLVTSWISKGAKPTDTVARLLSKAGMKNMDQYMDRYTKKKKRNAPDEPEAPPPAPVANEESAESSDGQSEANETQAEEVSEESGDNEDKE